MNDLFTSTAYGRCGGLQVLDSSACVDRLAELTQYENRHFGEAFSWTVAQNAFWTERSCALYAAIVQGGTSPRIVASMSVLLVSPDSCKRLVAGEISEKQLETWNQEPGCERPVIYFASVIASAKAFLPVLYASLAEDTTEALQKQRVRPREGFAIAASDAGRQHLERNGFRRLDDERYLGEHVFMRIKASYAQTPFWRRVLNAEIENSGCSAEPYALPTRRPFYA